VRHPVESVSWTDCGEILPRAGLVLPTEAQWERACRGGTDTVYWCGDAIASIQVAKAGNVADLTASKRTPWTCTTELEDGHVLHAPVGSFSANAYGLHDVLGNVWEWCEDGYDERGYDRPTREGDGLRLVWRARARVFRGGSFGDTAESARSASRHRSSPDARNNDLGVRPARPHHP
jgi:formylglycine-generating enzyme required for sulfatase activity